MFDDDGESALENALRAVYPGSEPQRFGVPDSTSAKVALAGCIATRLAEPVPHWLVVSRGFTELEEKVEDDPEISGWGFELTCRLPARSDEPDFGWIVSWMQNIADYLADSVTVLDAGHHMPMWQTSNEDEIAAIVFIDDVELGPALSRNGSFSFLQMVGLTNGEYEALKSWDARALVDLMHERDPLLLVDSERATYLRDPEFARQVDAGRERDGSSLGAHYGVSLFWFSRGDTLHVHLDSETVRLVKQSMKSRLAHGKAMTFFGDRRKTVRADGSLAVRSQVNLVLRPERGESEVTDGEDGGKLCVLRLDATAVAELPGVLDEAPGSYVLPSLATVRFVVETAERMREPR